MDCLEPFISKGHCHPRGDDRRAWRRIIRNNRNGLRRIDVLSAFGPPKTLQPLDRSGDMGSFARMMEGPASKAASPKTVMIDRNCFKSGRTVTSARHVILDFVDCVEIFADRDRHPRCLGNASVPQVVVGGRGLLEPQQVQVDQLSCYFQTLPQVVLSTVAILIIKQGWNLRGPKKDLAKDKKASAPLFAFRPSLRNRLHRV